MEKPVVRVAIPTDQPLIQDLTTRAFGREDEARIIRQLESDGDVILQLVAVMEERVVGHVLFYSLGVRGKLGAAGETVELSSTQWAVRVVTRSTTMPIMRRTRVRA